MIKVKIITLNPESAWKKDQQSELEDFLNGLGEEKIINIVACPACVPAKQPLTPPTLYTIFYRA